MKTFWERLQRVADNDPSVGVAAINTIVVHYDDAEGLPGRYPIRSAAQAVAFLKMHASFAAVQQTFPFLITMRHISCVHEREHAASSGDPLAIVDHLTIEEFYPEGPSMLEQDLQERAHCTERPSITRP